MAKSKKPDWLKRKIAEGYARRAGKTARGLLNPEQRTLMDQIENDAEAASAKRLAAALQGDHITTMYHVPQWNQNGTLTWHDVSMTRGRRFSCGSCGNSWQDNGQGLRHALTARNVAQVQSEACEHIGQVAVAGRLPWVEDAAAMLGTAIRVFRPPALWVEQTTARINDGITRQITDRQRLQENQLRAQREQERQREAEDRNVLQRTQIMHQIVTEVESLPEWERGNIQRAIDGLVDALRHRPVAQHLPPFAQVLNTLRGPLTTEFKYRALVSLLDQFTGPSPEQLQAIAEQFRQAQLEQARVQVAQTMIRHPDGTLSPYDDVAQVTRNALADNLFAESPFQRALGTRTGARPVSAKALEPPKPTGHRFSTKRKFKLPEDKK